MDRDLFLVLFGAAIALVSSITVAIVNHTLSLRADRIQRETEKKDKDADEQRKILIDGIQRKPTTVCKFCKRVYPSGMRYCPKCGRRLIKMLGKTTGILPGTDLSDVKICSQCGDINMPEAMFCDTCGASLSEENSQEAS